MDPKENRLETDMVNVKRQRGDAIRMYGPRRGRSEVGRPHISPRKLSRGALAHQNSRFFAHFVSLVSRNFARLLSIGVRRRSGRKGEGRNWKYYLFTLTRNVTSPKQFAFRSSYFSFTANTVY